MCECTCNKEPFFNEVEISWTPEEREAIIKAFMEGKFRVDKWIEWKRREEKDKEDE